MLLLHASEVLKIYSFPWAWASTTKDLFNTDVCMCACACSNIQCYTNFDFAKLRKSRAELNRLELFLWKRKKNHSLPTGIKKFILFSGALPTTDRVPENWCFLEGYPVHTRNHPKKDGQMTNQFLYTCKTYFFNITEPSLVVRRLYCR